MATRFLKTCGLVLILLLTIVPLVPSSAAPAPDWDWTRSAGGTASDNGGAVALDGSGNSYVTGGFSGTASFGSITLTSAGGTDIFVAKLDDTGSVLWAISAGGSDYDIGHAIAVDDLGNCYVTGIFRSTANFGTISLISSGNYDAFVTKLDSDGTVLWVTSGGGAGLDTGEGIAVDGLGNCYTVGSFEGGANLWGTTRTSAGIADVFAVKLDGSGSQVWITTAGGISRDEGEAIAVDDLGNSFITGSYMDAVPFDSTTLTSVGSSDIFVAKLDGAGSFTWATSAGGASVDFGSGIGVDDLGNSYVTGRYSSPATFGGTVLTSASQTVFVTKLDDSGTFEWAISGEGNASAGGHDIAVSDDGTCYVAGDYAGTLTLGDTTFTSGMWMDAFVTKVDRSGKVWWATSAGDTSQDMAHGIDQDGLGNCYVTGQYGDTVNFGDTTLTSAGDHDIFVAKIGKFIDDATVSGFFFHDEAGSGVRQPWSLGVAGGAVTANGGTAGGVGATSSTSGWYHLRMLEPGTSQIVGAPPSGSWWSMTSPETCPLVLDGSGVDTRCDFGLWWGLDAPNGRFEAMADTTVHQWYPAPQGDDNVLRVRQPGVGSALLQFDVSSLPADVTITSAELELCLMDSSNQNRSYMTAYPVLEPWDEATVVWPEPAYGAPVGWDYLPKRGGGEMECAWMSLDPELIQGWLTDPGSNHGLIVRAEGSAKEVGQSYASREHAEAGLRPQLVVDYGP